MDGEVGELAAAVGAALAGSSSAVLSLFVAFVLGNVGADVPGPLVVAGGEPPEPSADVTHERAPAPGPVTVAARSTLIGHGVMPPVNVTRP